MSDLADAIDRRLTQKKQARDEQTMQHGRAITEKERVANEVTQMCRQAVGRLNASGIPGVPVVLIPQAWGFRGSVARDADRIAWSLGGWTLTSTFDLWTDKPCTVADFAASDAANQRRITAAFKRSGFAPAELILPAPQHLLVDITQYRAGFGVRAPAVPGSLIHLPVNDGALSVVPLDEKDRQLVVPRFIDIFADKVATLIDRR